MAIVLSVALYIGIIWIMTELAPLAFKSKLCGTRIFFKICMAVLPAMIAAFRGSTGSDSLMYMNSYYNLQEVVESRTNGFEIGYQIIVRVFNWSGLSHTYFFFFINFMTILFFERFLESELENIDIKFSTFLFYVNIYILSFNAMRQCLAITMGLYAYSLYSRKKYLRYTIIVLLSASIHVSGLMAFAIVFCDIIMNNKYYRQFTYIAIIIGSILIFERNILANILGALSNADYAEYIRADFGGHGNVISFLAKNIIPLLILLMVFHYQSLNKKYKNYFILTLAGYIFTMLSLVTGTQADRIGLNSQCLNIATLSYAIVSPPKIYLGGEWYALKSVDVKRILYLFFILLYAFNWLYKGFGGMVPYAPLSKL